MAQPGIELVRDLIARFFNGHNPDLAPECFDPDFCWHGMVVEQWAAEDWIAFLGAIGAFTPPWAGLRVQGLRTFQARLQPATPARFGPA